MTQTENANHQRTLSALLLDTQLAVSHRQTPVPHLSLSTHTRASRAALHVHTVFIEDVRYRDVLGKACRDEFLRLLEFSHRVCLIVEQKVLRRCNNRTQAERLFFLLERGKRVLLEGVLITEDDAVVLRVNMHIFQALLLTESPKKSECVHRAHTHTHATAYLPNAAVAQVLVLVYEYNESRKCTVKTAQPAWFYIYEQLNHAWQWHKNNNDNARVLS